MGRSRMVVGTVRHSPLEATKVMTPMSSHLERKSVPAARKARTIEVAEWGGRNVDT